MSDGVIHDGHRGNVTFSAFINKLSLKTLYRLPIKLDDFISGKFIVQIPKGWFNVTVIGGDVSKMRYVRDTLLLIPLGNQCDSVCAFSRDCYTGTDDDEYVIRGALDKQFCTISIYVKDIYGGNIMSCIRVLGHNDGFNLLTLEPHVGEFDFNVPSTVSGAYSVRLPRQSDTSLEAQIDIGNRFKEKIPLGKMMVDLGYNWGTLSLDDFSIVLEYNQSEMSVTVSDWEIKKISI